MASSDALAELRDLVRGIHPPVLADRGLVGAVQALALAVADAGRRARRADGPAAGAGRVGGLLRRRRGADQRGQARAREAGHADRRPRSDDTLALEIRDDGTGGADPAGGTGLRGIERRLSAFDGTLAIESPPGGPTVLAMVLPCASSSPKTSPSSGTA